MSCEQATRSLGVYLLGGLDPAERGEVEEHVAGCPPCRRELAELARLPDLLATLSLEDVQAGPVRPPTDGYQRLAARVAADARRRRIRIGVAVAAAVAVLAAVGGGVAVRAREPARASYAASAGPVRMTVTLTPQDHGTGLDVAVSGLAGEERCRLVAVGRDGRRETAGAWEATYGGRVEVKGATSIPPAQLASLVLLGRDGRPLVTVRP